MRKAGILAISLFNSLIFDNQKLTSTNNLYYELASKFNISKVNYTITFN